MLRYKIQITNKEQPMKRFLLTMLLLALAAFAFAQFRSLFWELSTPDSITNYVTTPFTGEYESTDPNWRLHVVSSHAPEALISSDWGKPIFCSVCLSDIGAGYPMAFAYVDIHQAWNYLDLLAVPESAVLTCTLTYLPTGKSDTKTYTVKGWSDPIWIMDYVEPGTTWVLPPEMFVADPPAENKAE